MVIKRYVEPEPETEVVEPEQLLCIGGVPEYHGTRVPDQGNSFTVMFQVPENDQGIPAGTAVPTTYFKRPMFVTVDNIKYRRFTYVHESLQPPEAAQLLGNFLIADYLRGGEPVEDDASEVVSSGAAIGAVPVGDGTSRTASGLYIS